MPPEVLHPKKTHTEISTRVTAKQKEKTQHLQLPSQESQLTKLKLYLSIPQAYFMHCAASSTKYSSQEVTLLCHERNNCSL